MMNLSKMQVRLADKSEVPEKASRKEVDEFLTRALKLQDNTNTIEINPGNKEDAKKLASVFTYRIRTDRRFRKCGCARRGALVYIFKED